MGIESMEWLPGLVNVFDGCADLGWCSAQFHACQGKVEKCPPSAAGFWLGNFFIIAIGVGKDSLLPTKNCPNQVDTSNIIVEMVIL
jgi:hypothetical protein